MIRRKKKFTFDLSFPCMQPKVFQRLGETQATDIEVEVVSGGVPFNLTGVRFGFEMRDDEGKIVIDENQSRFTLTDVEKGKFTYRVDDKVFGFHGNAYLCYFSLKISDIRITTERFIITNDEDVQEGTEGLREHYVSVIDDLIASNKAAMEEAKKVQDLIEKNQVVKKTDIYLDWVTPTGNARQLNLGTDLDTVTTPGLYGGGKFVNSPDGGTDNAYIEVWTYGSYVFQRFISMTGSNRRVFERRKSSTSWGGWLRLIYDEGGTMTGNLTLDRPDNTVTRDFRWTTGGKSDVYIGLDKDIWRAYATGLGMIFSYDKNSKEFVVPGDTNLLKKTEVYAGWVAPDGRSRAINDTDLNTIINAGIYTGQRLTNQPENLSGFFYIEVIPYTNTQFVKQQATTLSQTTQRQWFRTLINNVWQPWVEVTNHSKDGRATLTLTSDATVGTSGAIQLATRRGNTVSLSLDIQRNNGATGLVVTNLPASMRPVDSYAFDVVATDGTPSRVLIRSNGEVHLDVTGKRYRILTTYVVD